MPHNNFNNFGQGPVGGMGGGSQFAGGMSGGNPFTSGGMFGPVGGPQNIGGGQGQMSDRELQELMQMYQSQGGGGGGALPNYNPALAGPAGPQELNTSGLGINPAGMASGGLGGVDPTGAGAIGTGMGDVQEGLLSIAMKKAEEERMLEMMLKMGGGGMGGGGNYASGMQWGVPPQNWGGGIPGQGGIVP